MPRSWNITMNKQDISDIRRHFKVDSELLKINEIYNVYIRKETSEIFYEESRPFAFRGSSG